MYLLILKYVILHITGKYILLGFKNLWRNPDVSEQLSLSKGLNDRPHQKQAEAGGNPILQFLLLRSFFEPEHGGDF
jgi:hypothetical protein